MTRYPVLALTTLILILAACEPGPERPTYGTVSPFTRQGEPQMQWPGDRSPTAQQAQRAATEAARRQLPRQPDSVADLNDQLEEEFKREVVRSSVRRLQEHPERETTAGDGDDCDRLYALCVADGDLSPGMCAGCRDECRWTGEWPGVIVYDGGTVACRWPSGDGDLW